MSKTDGHFICEVEDVFLFSFAVDISTLSHVIPQNMCKKCVDRLFQVIQICYTN